MTKEAMKLALEALKFEDSGDPECEHGFMHDKCPNDECDKRRFYKAIKALEEALAKQEHGEPVAWMLDGEIFNTQQSTFDGVPWEGQIPLYTTPQQPSTIVRKPLTDEQESILNFLLGANDFEGVWYGERHPQKKGAFWWRDELRKAFQEAAHGIKE